MELKHISIVVVEICGKGDFTTNTDILFRHCCVDDRIVVDIDDSVISRGATVFVNQLNGEAVRIVSVRSGHGHGLTVGTGCCAVGQNLVVLIPGEVIRARRSRGHVGMHHNVACQGVAHDRIRNKNEYRIREYCDSISTLNLGFATRSGLGNLNCIVPNGDITIESLRSLAVNRIRCCSDNFAIAIPSVKLTTRNTLANMSSESDITTFTNRIITLSKVSSNAVNDRNVIGCN